MKTDIFYKIENDVIAIRVDPDMIDDLIRVLESLLSIAHTVKNKARYESKKSAERREKEAALRMAQFQAEAVKVWLRYQEHINGCNGSKPLAMQKIKKEFGMGYTDADIYISEGRKALRQKKTPPGRSSGGANGVSR